MSALSILTLVSITCLQNSVQESNILGAGSLKIVLKFMLVKFFLSVYSSPTIFGRSGAVVSYC